MRKAIHGQDVLPGKLAGIDCNEVGRANVDVNSLGETGLCCRIISCWDSGTGLNEA